MRPRIFIWESVRPSAVTHFFFSESRKLARNALKTSYIFSQLIHSFIHSFIRIVVRLELVFISLGDLKFGQFSGWNVLNILVMFCIVYWVNWAISTSKIEKIPPGQWTDACLRAHLNVQPNWSRRKRLQPTSSSSHSSSDDHEVLLSIYLSI